MTQASRPIWSKRTAQAGPSARALAYCAGRDVRARPPADAELIPYDLWTNRAHVWMLRRQGIITPATHLAIVKGLAEVERQWQTGEFKLDPSLEDVHMNIERRVAEIAGEAAAGAIHTARSRNDQSATDVRLWLRDQLLRRLNALTDLISTLARFARRHAATTAPGWTHAQPAMPTTLGHWAAAHAWALARDAEALAGLWSLINQSPLGAAASFGTSWPIDRELTTRLLSFDHPQPNCLDCISTRWEAEARLGAALGVMMTHLSSLGQDLIFLASPPWSAIRLADAHVTGSSIMPNKRNPDFAEVTRARATAVHHLAGDLLAVGCGALSGYNRDTQWTKYWIMDLMDEVGEAPELFTEVVGEIAPDKVRLKQLAAEGFSLAADLADHLARTRKIPFRQAYHIVAEAVQLDEAHSWVTPQTFNTILEREGIEPLFEASELAAAGDPAQVLPRRNSQGGPAPDQVRRQAEELTALATHHRRWVRQRRRRLDNARTQTWNKR